MQNVTKINFAWEFYLKKTQKIANDIKVANQKQCYKECG